MYLNRTIKILILLLFKFKELIPTNAINLENDITKAIDDWISKIFEIDAENAEDLFGKLSLYHLDEFEYNSSQKLDNFGPKLFFQNIEFRQVKICDSSKSNSESESHEWDQSYQPSIQIYWKFPENKIRITLEQFGVRIKGTLCKKKNQPYADFSAYLEFENTTFVVVNNQSSTKLDLMKISHDFSYTYNDFQQKHVQYEGAMEWTSFEKDLANETSGKDSHQKNYRLDPPSDTSNYIDPLTNTDSSELDVSYENEDDDVSKTHLARQRHKTNTISSKEEEKITQEITPIFPLMLRENLKHNRKFIQSLGKLFQAYSLPRNKILTRHPDLFDHPRKFHYLIPKTPYLCFTLKRIVISGLSNLESFKVQNQIESGNGIFSHTLMIRNVEGTMTLDYGFEDEPPLKLNFHVDCLFISKKERSDCVYVQAKFYQVSRAKVNTSLTIRQAEVMMNGLESAIASSILPTSAEVGKTCELETPLEEITRKIANTSDWATIKESYKGWIPFNNDAEETPAEKFPFNVFQR